MRVKTKKRCECVCSRHPLLAYYGVDENDKPYVHVKVYKQERLYGEWFMQDGVCNVRCRDCYRWTKIVFKNPKNIKATHGVPAPSALAG